jgi:hypothetical protein
MTKREIAKLCCRVLAVYATVLAISRLSYIAQLFAPYEDTTWSPVFYRLLYAVEPVLLAIAAFFLWRWAGLVAAWMTGHDLHDHIDEAESAPTRASAIDVQAIIFSSLGVWLLIETIPYALSYISRFAYARSNDVRAEAKSLYLMTEMIELVARLGLGVGLLFGGPTIAHWVNRMRNVGLEKNQTTGASD